MSDAKKLREDPKLEPIWNVKYAMTEGPKLVKAEIKGDMAMVYAEAEDGTPITWNLPMYLHGEGKDWCRTAEEAVKRCEQLRIAKLKSLQKNITKLQAINFDKLIKDQT